MSIPSGISGGGDRGTGTGTGLSCGAETTSEVSHDTYPIDAATDDAASDDHAASDDAATDDHAAAAAADDDDAFVFVFGLTVDIIVFCVDWT